MEQWLKDSLSDILQFDVPQDMISYILAIDNPNELTKYMKTLLDFNNSQHKNFFLELSKQRFSSQGPNTQTKQQKKKNSKNKSQQNQHENIIIETQPSESPEKEQTTSASVNKKKTKFVNLYSQEGKNAQVITLKGRHHCDCQASKHELINNCIKCGRIVCTQEGSGPCLFCGNLVCTPQEQRELNAKTKASAKLMQSLMDQSRPKGWEAAVTHRNRLLEYDRTSERRTRVTDDDSDYFNANSVWLSETEKKKLNQYQQSLHDKKHQSRLHKKMTFDFAGRQVVEDKTIEHDVDEDKISEIMGGGARSGGLMQTDWFSGDGAGRDVAPGVNAPLLQFDESVESGYYAPPPRPDRGMNTSRIQDAEIQEMTDTGKCLSMHQPWASLLVDGIKLHEGRTWYTSHRGRLWIASTAKPPDPEVVRALEHQYAVLYPEKNFKFPSFYPAGCLLGCVNVDDCLPQEEYDKVYPGGESDSPYVFICSNPVSLKLRFPVKGQHKIYQLDKTIHQAAVKFIQRMAKIQADEANAG